MCDHGFYKLLESLFGPFCVVKFVVVILVTALLMYTCQTFARNVSLDERRKYSAVKVEMEQKNSSLSVEGNNRKKRQRKKKKSVKSNLEETVQGSNRSGLVKDFDVTCNDALKGNVRKAKGDMWKSNKTCEVAVPKGRVHQSKDTAKGNRGVAQSTGVSHGGQDFSAALLVNEEKPVGSLARCSKKLFLDAVGSVLNRNIGQGKSPRSLLNADEAPAKDFQLKNDSGNLKDDETHHHMRFNCAANTKQSMTSGEAKEMNSQGDDVTESEKFGSNRHPTDGQRSDNDSENHGNPTIDEKGQRRKIEGNQDFKDRKTERCSYIRRNSENDSLKIHLTEDDFSYNSGGAVDQRRRRSSDGGLSNSGNESLRSGFTKGNRSQPMGNQRRRRSSNDARRNSTRDSETSESHRHPTESERRRGYSDHLLENSASGDELPENCQHRTKKERKCNSVCRSSKNNTLRNDLAQGNVNHPIKILRRRRSSDATSENDATEIERLGSDTHAARSQRVPESFDHISGNENLRSCHREEDLSQLIGNQRRRRSADDALRNNTRESEWSGNHRHPTEGETRRRYSDHISENNAKGDELTENYQQCTKKKGKCNSVCRSWQNNALRNDLPQGDVNQPIKILRQRRSSDATSENDATESEPLRSDTLPARNQRRQETFHPFSGTDVKGISTGNEERWNSIDHSAKSGILEGELPVDYLSDTIGNRRRRKSFGGASEKDSRETEHSGSHRYPIRNQRRRGALDNLSENGSKGNKQSSQQFKEKKGGWSSVNCPVDNNRLRNKVPEDRFRNPWGNRRRRTASDGILKYDSGSGELPENIRPHWTSNRTRSESEIGEENERKSYAPKEPSLVHISIVDSKAERTSPIHEVGRRLDSTAMEKQEQVESRQAKGQFWIDPEVRERIANPKYPVCMPDKPFLHRSYQNGERYDDNIGPNKSFVGGMFGREWRLKKEREDLKREVEEDAEEDRRRAMLIHPGDNICPTFMIWGVCHRGDNCHLRHPPGRYLERPPRNAVKPESVSEEPKRDPNSYAAVLEKKKNAEPEKFFNDCLLQNVESREETIGRSYSNALVRKDDSKIPTTRKSFEEEWPCLGSPVQIHSKTKQATQGPCVIEKVSASVSKMQNANDRVIAESLQADEYAALEVFEADEYVDQNEDDTFPDYQEQEFVNQLEQDTNKENHLETKGHELEDFSSSYSSNVVTHQSTRDEAVPSPPPVITSVCDICMDRPKDATLVCGHRFCYQCSLQMRLDEGACAICRRCIVSVIKTYN
ncbi:uncharacterized protein [Montipora foliosa]|uniref:uncharacterized protein isoform X2 n=1 Tax=Montipora foliosa TaxID=591990 RepID=UPI0035F2187F